MKGAEVAAGLLIAAAIIAGALALQGLAIMLVLGGLHDHVSESIPAVGFGGSVLIGVGLSIVGSFFRSSSK